MILTNKLFVTCPRGLEEPLSKEIKEILDKPSEVDLGGVHLKGDEKDIFRLNLETRSSMFVLQEITRFSCIKPDDLYNKVKSYPWHKIMLPSDTFSIKTRVNSKFFPKSNYLTLKIKDAIVDRIRMEKGARPSIDKEDPTYSLFFNIKNSNVIVYLNTSGAPLYIRGYRGKVHRASLNQSLAAGLVLLSNWDKKSPFYDPMCGSGTIIIEALMYALNIPPRINRSKYAFQKWKNFNSKLFSNMKTQSLDKILPSKSIDIYGSDNTDSNIDLLRKSLELLNQTNSVKLNILDIGDFKTYSNKGTIIMNPPHGHRMSQVRSLEGLYRKIGDRLKNECAGHDAYIFCMNNNLPKQIGLRTKRRYILKNGKLDCRLLYFPLSEGKYA